MRTITIPGFMLVTALDFGLTAHAGNDLAATQTRDDTTRSIFKNATTPTDFGGGVAGAACVYDNYNPLDDVGFPASQTEPVYPFYAEAADDFTLPGEPANGCILDQVIFAVTWFSVAGGVTPDPDFCWTGVNITVYEDALEFCSPGFLKGPAGEPLDQPPQNHIEYCPGGVVCEIRESLSNLTGMPLVGECWPGSIWEVIVFGLKDWQCTLQKDHKYWIAIAPEQVYTPCGQTAIVLSANKPQGQPTQQIFLLLALPWTVINGNFDVCPPDTPPAGSHRDLSIGIAAIKTCAWDLANDDGTVDARDLATLLGAWGNPYGPVELANLLGSWGPC